MTRQGKARRGEARLVQARQKTREEKDKIATTSNDRRPNSATSHSRQGGFARTCWKVSTPARLARSDGHTRSTRRWCFDRSDTDRRAVAGHRDPTGWRAWARGVDRRAYATGATSSPRDCQCRHRGRRLQHLQRSTPARTLRRRRRRPQARLRLPEHPPVLRRLVRGST